MKLSLWLIIVRHRLTPSSAEDIPNRYHFGHVSYDCHVGLDHLAGEPLLEGFPTKHLEKMQHNRRDWGIGPEDSRVAVMARLQISIKKVCEEPKLGMVAFSKIQLILLRGHWHSCICIKPR